MTVRFPALMPGRLARTTASLAVALASLGLAACGEKEAIVHEAETEGIYLDVGELDYQVQISREVNPRIVPDDAYVLGVPDFVAPPTGEETWFAVFMRVQNQTDEPHTAASEIRIVDTQGNEYRPVPLDPEENPLAYQATEVGPGETLPARDSTASNSSAQGALLLFKVSYESLGNRPIELEIEGEDGEAGRVDLDI